MRLTRLTLPCNSAACPQVYATDRDTVVVQGTLLPAHGLAVDLGPGEALVEIPLDVFLAAAAAQAGAPGTS
jgi:hypothetical protein